MKATKATVAKAAAKSSRSTVKANNKYVAKNGTIATCGHSVSSESTVKVD